MMEIHAYAESMNALRDEESLLWVQRMNIGFGLMKKHESQRVLAKWRHNAQPQGADAERADPRKQKIRDQLARMGLGVREVKRGAT